VKPKTRAQYLEAIKKSLSFQRDAQETKEAIQALLLTAATLANAISDQPSGFAQALVTESAEDMIAVLDDTFGVDI
jgi:hypothetical protein